MRRPDIRTEKKLLFVSHLREEDPDPSIRGACFVVASGSHPHVPLCTLRCDPSLRLAPAAFSTARVFKVLQAYARIMDKKASLDGIRFGSKVGEGLPRLEGKRATQISHWRSSFGGRDRSVEEPLSCPTRKR